MYNKICLCEVLCRKIYWIFMLIVIRKDNEMLVVVLVKESDESVN